MRTLQLILLSLTLFLSQGGYSDQREWIGPAMLLDENGQVKSEKTYKDGIEKTTYWYENGQIKRETNYKDAKPDGKATEWYENGQIKTEHNYQLSKPYPVFIPNRKWTKWYENGQKEGEGYLKDGKKDGKSTKWDESGQIAVQENYKDGELID